MKKIGAVSGMMTLLLAFAIGACAEQAAPSGTWWQNAVFYQIWPRSFADSDGNGVGDFKGMTAKLDYLADLGITGIWLTPMFEAPSYHGYDFQEFYQVESDYGTMADFDEFLQETEKRGIKVIADLVLNHISTQNDWFKKSAQKIDPYTDYFVWSKEIPAGAWGKPWATPEHPDWGYNKPEWVWIFNEERGEYYYAAFDGSQPDLNLRNPNVVEELKKLAKFWIDKGFDGFRLDAIRYAIETGPYPGQADTEESLKFWTDFNQYVKSLNPNVMLIGEVWADTGIIAKYYDQGNGIDLCFDFNFGGELMNALNAATIQQGQFGSAGVAEGQKTLAQAMQANFKGKAESVAPVSFYSPFLTNHDQERVMHLLGDDAAKMKMAAVLLLTSVGAPFMYYGEEIGLTQTQTGDDIFKRAPMQWNDSAQAGFSTGDKVWVDDGKWVPWRKDHQAWWTPMWNAAQDKAAHSVAGQQADPNSLLNLYKKLIAIRKANPEFCNAENDSIAFLETAANVYAFKRTAPDGQASLVIMNGSLAEATETALEELKGKTFTNLLDGQDIAFADGNVSLAPGGFYLLKVK